MEHITGRIKRIKNKVRGHGVMNRIVAAVFIVSSVLSPLSPVFSATAYADEPETATVTLMDTDNGSLSFDGTDEKSISVNVGSEVTVHVTPNDGYYADSVSIFNDNEEGTAVDVVNGAAKFTVSGDTTVAAAFNENGSAGARALKPVAVSEQKNTASVEDYVLAHANVQYVGNGDELSRKDVLTVTTTVVDGSKLPDATLDKLWADTDGDGMSDNYTAMLSQAVSHAVLFEVDPDADYYVGWAGANIEGAKLTDWAAAENNADAVMRDGFIMDEATGLIYVPKSYTTTDDDGQPVVATSRIQLVYTVQDASAKATFDFSSNDANSCAEGVEDGKVSVPVVSAHTRVTLSSDGSTVDGNLIDSVTVNGIQYTSDMNMWSYDEQTGTLEFFMAPSGIHCMTVNLSSNLLKKAASLLGISTYSTGVNNIGTWEFDSAPSAGQSFVVSATNTYESTSGSVHPAVENGYLGNYENKTIYQALGTQAVNVNGLSSGNYSIERTSTIHAQTTNVVTIPSEVKVGLTCGHVGVNTGFQLDSGYNEPAATSDNLGAHIYVAAVYGNTAIIGVVVPTSHTQAGGGFFEINWKLNNGYAKVQKVSANPSVTDGNDCYSLKGAEFTVYNGSGAPVGTLTTDESGNTNTLELPTGTYTLKETKTPEGYLKASDQQFTVNGGQTTVITVADPPSNDPMAILLGKFDGQKTYNGESNLPQGSASLAGAEFTIEYYDTLDYDSYDAIKDADVKPTRTWVVSTDNDGFTYLDDSHLVSGDSIYHDASNNVIIPRGTVVVYESKAPEGYLLNKDFVSFQKIQETPLSTVTTYNMPTAPETVKRGGVKVQKLDAESGLNAPLGDAASFDGTEFAITTLSDNPVIVDGVTYSKGDVVKTIVVKDGHASTSADCLPYGDYSLREVKATEGYNLDNTDHKFSITEDGVIVNPFADTNGAAQNQVKRSDLEFSKKGDDTAEHLAGVAFKVTSNTTGESHIVVTDENGYFSSASSWNKHTENTNGNDWALNENGVIDSSKLDKSAGVWFGLTTEGSMTKANDSLGALPYDSYTIEELPCTANEGYSLVKTSVIITRDSVSYDFGTLDDLKPEISTNAYDPTDGDSQIGVGDVAIADKVTYGGLSKGDQYRLNATLVDASTGKAILVDGKPVTATKTFTAQDTTGSEVVEMNVSTFGLGDKTVTVYEELYDLSSGTERLVAKHTDKDDTDQQLQIVAPKIGTTASDGVDGDKNVVTDDTTTVVDTVSYKNLIPGKEYTLKGTLHVKATDDDGNVTEKALEVDGQPVTAETTFTPEAADGTVDVTFTFDATDIPDGTDLVAFESIERSGVEIASHADINDESQTVTVHKSDIGTTASDGLDGDKKVIADAETTITDSIAYNNVLSDTGYTMAGILMDKETGLPILTGDDSNQFTQDDVKSFMDKLSDITGVNSKERTPVDLDTLRTFLKDNADLVSHLVFQCAEFTPDNASGTVSMDFDFDSNAVIDRLNGETKDVVVFEVLFKGSLDDETTEAPVVVATEQDLDNKDQTVTLIPSTIGTTATDASDGDHELMAGKDAVITDTVSYEGLIPGKEYTLKATLYDKATGEPLSVNDKHVTAELRFTPNSESGSIDIDLGPFDATALNGHDLVVYEELYKQSSIDGKSTDILVAQHKDLNDKDQTVTVTSTPKGGFYGKTGGNDAGFQLAIVLLIAAAVGLGLYGLKCRRAAKQEEADSDSAKNEDSGSEDGTSES